MQTEENEEDEQGNAMARLTEKYGKYISIGITAVVIALSFIGSYQYYTGYVEEVIYDRLWSSVFYSTLQLYLFSPTVDPGSATPICYEVAKWMAPLCTAYWVFKAIESLFRHNVAVLKRKKSRKKQIIVFGYHETGEIFLRNLVKSKKDHLVVLVTETDLEKEVRLGLERDGILVYRMSLVGQEPSKAEESFRHLHLEQADEVVLFYEDATWNFALLKQMTEWETKKGRTEKRKKTAFCSIWCEERTMKKIITDYYDKQEGERPWNLNIFSLPEMAATELFERQPLYKNCLEQAVESAARQKDEDDTENAGGFMEMIPQPHLLLIGFGRYGQAVFEKALLTGTLSDRSKVKDYQKLQITIIDKEAKQCREIVESRYPRIDRICQVNYIDSDIACARIEKILSQFPQVTYIAICFSDQTTCVSAMEKIQTYLSAAETRRNEEKTGIAMQVPIAVRMKTDDAVIQYWNPRQNRQDKMLAFGNDKQTLTWENVIRYHVEEEAKEYHAEYSWIQSRLNDPQEPDAKKEEGREEYKQKYREKLWNALNYELKESCRAQVLNRPYFRELQERLGGLPKQEEVLTLDINALFERFSENPPLEMLAALEHKRWCAFCYVYGYVGFHPDPAEKRTIHVVKENGEIYCGKVHNCLIDDWDKMKADEKVNNTIIYDVCSVYGYRKETEGRQ